MNIRSCPLRYAKDREKQKTRGSKPASHWRFSPALDFRLAFTASQDLGYLFLFRRVEAVMRPQTLSPILENQILSEQDSNASLDLGESPLGALPQQPPLSDPFQSVLCIWMRLQVVEDRPRDHSILF